MLYRFLVHVDRRHRPLDRQMTRITFPVSVFALTQGRAEAKAPEKVLAENPWLVDRYLAHSDVWDTTITPEVV